MSRYHRINIDGKSMFKTETALVASAADLKPGTFVTLNGSGLWIQSTASTGRMYVIDAPTQRGGGVTDLNLKGESATGNYVEEGRELAVLCAAGTYKKDTPIKVNSSGLGTVGTDGTDAIVGFSQDDVVLSAEGLIRVRMRATWKAAS